MERRSATFLALIESPFTTI